MYLEPLLPGRAYGLGKMQGAGSPGQIVHLVDHDTFAVNLVPAQASFGVMYKPVKDGEMPTVYCNGGIYETDNFTAPIVPDELLKVHNVNGNLTAGVGAADKPVAQAIAVQGGVLRFKLLV